MGNCSSAPTAIPTTATATSTPAATDPRLVNLLGDTLVSSSGRVATSDTLGGRAVAIYFSAHWCPPCRGFTPILAKAYRENLKEKGLEIIFVSSDQNEAAFASYFKDMPWLALPFAAREVKAKLSEKFRVSGIPTLVLLDSSGKLISTDGRSKVMSDPTGKWVPCVQPLSHSQPTAEVKAAETKTAAASASGTAIAGGLATVLGSAPLLDTDGKTSITLAQVAKDVPLIAIYFSAHWCGPCRAFTPKLKAFVEMLDKDGVRLPIVFGSSDSDESAFAEYFDTMPWYAFPFSDARISTLKTKFEVSGIPWLVVLDANGNLVANEADEDLPMGALAYEKWLKQAKKQPVAAAPAA